MKLLALETSSTACSIALDVDGKRVFVHKIMPMQQAQWMLPLLNECLQSVNSSIKQLDAIAFGCGPGSFTGVRIAVSLAQGLAFPYAIPVVPISSLAAHAQTVFQELGWEKIAVGIDARMQEVYWGLYQLNEAGLMTLTGQERAASPRDVELPNGPNWYGAGNAWDVYRKGLSYLPKKTNTSSLPTAAAVLTLAKAKFAQGDWVKPEDAVPTYLRNTLTHRTV